MKTIPHLILLAGLVTAISLRAFAQSDAPAQDSPPPPPPGEEPAAQPAEPTTAEGSNPRAVVQVLSTNGDVVQSSGPATASPTATSPAGSDELRLNFRGVPLEMVLNYLSDAAGFIIIEDTQVHGNVDVWSGQPLSKDEAVDLLNTVLDKNGYAAIRNGRTLNIVAKDDAKTKNIPVVSGGDPDQIPQTDEMVTQIIPVRFVEAEQLIKDIQPLVSLQSTITANEAGNAVIITDTRANIHRVAEIIKAIDTGAQAVTEVRVFHLAYADPVEMATLLGNLFPSDSSSGSQTPVRFGGRGGGFGGFFGGGGGGGAAATGASSSTSDRIKKMQRVIAVADQRTASVVVSAPNDLMDQISRMITQLDNNPAKKQGVYVFHLENADPEEILPVLQDMFQKNTTSRSSSSRSSTQSPLMSRGASTSTSSGTGSSSSGSTGIGGGTGGGFGGGGGGGGRTGGGGAY